MDPSLNKGISGLLLTASGLVPGEEDLTDITDYLLPLGEDTHIQSRTGSWHQPAQDKGHDGL